MRWSIISLVLHRACRNSRSYRSSSCVHCASVPGKAMAFNLWVYVYVIKRWKGARSPEDHAKPQLNQELDSCAIDMAQRFNSHETEIVSDEECKYLTHLLSAACSAAPKASGASIPWGDEKKIFITAILGEVYNSRGKLFCHFREETNVHNFRGKKNIHEHTGEWGIVCKNRK